MSAAPDIVICVQGPTASGKSELAERIALSLPGEIISADSMQIYRGMDIGTAKVSCDKRGVAYHCLDILDPGQPYSAALFQQDARRAIGDVVRRGRVPILCGGTGLYIRAAVDDMSFAEGEQASPARERFERLALEKGAGELHRMLRASDPASADIIHPNNVRRVIRALEMQEQGESYALRKEAFKKIPALYPRVKFAMDVDRDLLYARINSRVDSMLEAGLVDEVQELLNKGFRNALTAAQAIGYKEIVSFLDGKCSLDEAADSIKQSTRRYAKRQLSWLRADDEIIWLHADDGVTDTLVERALDEIERVLGR